MALGALTLPSVSTGFSRDSKALVPVSIQGVADKVNKESPLATMLLYFLDVRDGIVNLGEIFSEKISGLNSHLAFRFEQLNQTLLDIAGITADDLEIQKSTAKEDAENEAQDERDEALDDKRKGKDEDGDKRGWLDSLKDAFGRTKEAFAGGLGTKMKLLLLALGLVALTKYTEQILPKLKIVLARMKKIAGWFTRETGELDEDDKPIMELNWTKILGVGAGLWITKILAGMAFKAAGRGLITGFAKLAPHLVKGAALLGPAAVAAYGVYSAFQIMGDAAAAKDWTKEAGASDNELINKLAGGLGGKLEGGIGNAFRKAGHWAGVGAMLGIWAGPPGMLVGGIIGGMIGGILGWIGGGKIAQAMDWVVDGFNGMWESVKTAISDVFYDREVADGPAGAVRTQRSLAGKLKDSLDNMIESISNWIYDGKGVVFGMDFSGLSNLLPTLQEIADSIVSSLPKWMRPDTIMEKMADTKAEIEKHETYIAEGDYRTATGRSREKIVANLKKELAELEAEFGVSTGDKKTYNINETYVDNVVKKASAMKAKKDMLTSLTMAKDDTAPANITTIMDNKKVTNAVSTNHHMVAMANVDHTDVAVKHIIDIRHNRNFG